MLAGGGYGECGLKRPKGVQRPPFQDGGHREAMPSKGNHLCKGPETGPGLLFSKK